MQFGPEGRELVATIAAGTQHKHASGHLDEQTEQRMVMQDVSIVAKMHCRLAEPLGCALPHFTAPCEVTAPQMVLHWQVMQRGMQRGAVDLDDYGTLQQEGIVAQRHVNSQERSRGAQPHMA